MKNAEFEERLLAIEKQLSGSVSRDRREAGNDLIDTAGDAGDRSVSDVSVSDHFTAAELDSAVLSQVRDALQRIADGTFGQCTVDGGPIETKRLKAVPWTPYCLKHQSLLEAAGQTRTFTL